VKICPKNKKPEAKISISCDKKLCRKDARGLVHAALDQNQSHATLCDGQVQEATEYATTGGDFPPPENLKTLHSNFDICRNFQRIKMKFYILIMKILYSNSATFQKCSVCARFDVSCLSSEGREHPWTLETSSINTTLLSHQWSKVYSQETMPGDRNSILCSHCVNFTFTWGYCRLLFKSFCILCSVPYRCLSFTTKFSRCKGNSKFTRASKLLGVVQVVLAKVARPNHNWWQTWPNHL